MPLSYRERGAASFVSTLQPTPTRATSVASAVDCPVRVGAAERQAVTRRMSLPVRPGGRNG